MVHLILKLNIIQKVPVFRKERNKPFVVPFADLLSFVLQIGTIALIYLLIEKPDELAKLSIIEGMNYYFREGIYFVFTTITTVGYGDKSPDTTAGMAFVIIALYLYGAYRLLNLIDAFVSAKSEIRELKRNGRLFETMKNHIIVYCDADSIKVDNFIWVKRFISEIKTSKKFSSNPVLFVNFNEEMAGRFNQFMAENLNKMPYSIIIRILMKMAFLIRFVSKMLLTSLFLPIQVMFILIPKLLILLFESKKKPHITKM